MSSEYYAVDYANRSLMDRYNEVINLPPLKSINAGRVIRIRNFIYDWLKKLNGGCLPKSAAMLDIGSGLGVFLKHFLETAAGDSVAWNATAVDSSPLACKHLRSLKNFKVIEEMFPGKTVLGNFDICTLNKIIEHIERPVEFLKNIRGVLKQNGIVYVEVPDRQTIVERKPKDNILGALHCHLYDPESILVLIEKAGFTPIHSKRIYEPSGKITTFAFAKKSS